MANQAILERRQIIQIVPAWVNHVAVCWTEIFSIANVETAVFIWCEGKYSATDERPFAGDGASASWLLTVEEAEKSECKRNLRALVRKTASNQI